MKMHFLNLVFWDVFFSLLAPNEKSLPTSALYHVLLISIKSIFKSKVLVLGNSHVTLKAWNFQAKKKKKEKKKHKHKHKHKHSSKDKSFKDKDRSLPPRPPSSTDHLKIKEETRETFSSFSSSQSPSEDMSTMQSNMSF